VLQHTALCGGARCRRDTQQTPADRKPETGAILPYRAGAGRTALDVGSGEIRDVDPAVVLANQPRYLAFAVRHDVLALDELDQDFAGGA
jgi:hypothetical protein